MAMLLAGVLLLIMGLLVGTMFGIAVGCDPGTLSAAAYLEQQKVMIRSLNVLLPAMGAVCIVLLGVHAWRTFDSDRLVMGLFCASALLMVCAALVTRLVNQPINAIVVSWTSATMPIDWWTIRDLWWKWHLVRCVCAVSAFVIAIAALMLRSRA